MFSTHVSTISWVGEGYEQLVDGSRWTAIV